MFWCISWDYSVLLQRMKRTNRINKTHKNCFEGDNSPWVSFVFAYFENRYIFFKVGFIAHNLEIEIMLSVQKKGQIYFFFSTIKIMSSYGAKIDLLVAHYKRFWFSKLEFPLLIQSTMCVGFTWLLLHCPAGTAAQETGVRKLWYLATAIVVEINSPLSLTRNLTSSATTNYRKLTEFEYCVESHTLDSFNYEIIRKQLTYRMQTNSMRYGKYKLWVSK